MVLPVKAVVNVLLVPDIIIPLPEVIPALPTLIALLAVTLVLKFIPVSPEPVASARVSAVKPLDDAVIFVCPAISNA